MDPWRPPERWPDREPVLMGVAQPVARAARLVGDDGAGIRVALDALCGQFFGAPDKVPSTIDVRDALRPLIDQLGRGEPGGRYHKAAWLLVVAGRTAGQLDAWHEARRPPASRR